MKSTCDRQAIPTPEGGFTLVEVTISLAVTLLVMIGILFLFDFNNKLAKVQTNITDMQQSLRVAQYDMVRMTRMAGRGGLPPILAGTVAPAPASLLPQSIGFGLQNNVADPTYLIPADATSPKVMPGSDVLTVRGVFSTPIYQIDQTKTQTFQLTGPGTPTPATATGGTIEICNQSPGPWGVIQDLSPLKNLTKDDALILVSPLGDQFYAVASMDARATSTVATSCAGNATPGGVTIRFVTDTYKNLFSTLGGAGKLPEQLTKVKYVGLLEEYRFYVREEHAVSGDADSELMPVLARARFYPGTDVAYDDLRQDIADGIMDLQVSIGLDTDGDGQVLEDLANPDRSEERRVVL